MTTKRVVVSFWIPAFAGMTIGRARMAMGGTGMTMGRDDNGRRA